MSGYSGNTFRVVKEDGTWHYAKWDELNPLWSTVVCWPNVRRFSAITDQGIKNNSNTEALLQAGEDADFGLTDLWDAIEAGNYPSWTIYFQVLSPKEAESFKCAFIR